MKKTYINPTVLVAAIQEDDTILAGSITEVVSDDTGIGYGGGTTEPGVAVAIMLGTLRTRKRISKPDSLNAWVDKSSIRSTDGQSLCLKLPVSKLQTGSFKHKNWDDVLQILR